MRIPRILTPHTVTLEPYLGRNPYGDVLGAPQTIRNCRVEDYTAMARSATGEQQASSARVTVRPEVGAIRVGSFVTLWPGEDQERRTRVMAVSYLDTPPAPTHYVLTLE